ncbi:MAG: sigma-70 family RNA polymerase sigma factor [Planctomycetota bacterium]
MHPEQLLDHLDFVRSLARRMVFDQDHADDLTQQACLAALLHPPQRAGIRAWLAKVTENAARKAARADRRRSRREREAPAAAAVPTPEQVLERERVRRQVVDAVLALDEPYRTTVLLRYFENLTPGDIAARLEVPVETVKTRLKRAMQRLRRGLDREHGDRRTWSLAVLPLMGVNANHAAVTASAAAAQTTGVLWMATNVKIAMTALILTGAAATAWRWTADPPPVAPPPLAEAGELASAAPHPEPAASEAPRAPAAPPTAMNPAATPSATPSATPDAAASAAEALAAQRRQLKTVFGSFRTPQPDYITWLRLLRGLVDQAAVVDGSIYVDDRGATRGRLELPGDLSMAFSSRDGRYSVSVKGLKSLLDEGSSFTELHANLEFAAGPNGIERAKGQVMFRDFTYAGLEPLTLGHAFSMNQHTLELTELTKRANPEAEGSWIYAPGQKLNIPFSDLEAAAAWHEKLRGLAPAPK